MVKKGVQKILKDERPKKIKRREKGEKYSGIFRTSLFFWLTVFYYV